MKPLLTSLFATALMLASCSTPKNVAYFQDLTNGTTVSAPAQQLDITIKPEDKLSIIVSTQDPALSTLFNLVTSNNRLGQSTSSTTTVGNTGSTGTGQTSYYTVSPQGDIDFPVLGKIHVAGLTRYQIAERIYDLLTSRDLVKDPIVTVEFANLGLSVLGEVKSPGRYEFNKDHLTIVDAVAMAGDLTINGMRDNVLVLRANPDGTQQAYRVNLTDMASLVASPVYYLRQDDVIYVEPNSKVKRDTTPNGNTPYTPSFWVSIGSFAVTIATLVITLTR